MGAAARQQVTVAELSDEQLAHTLWREGDLAWKLDPHQLRVYEKYRAWEAQDPRDDDRGSFARIFVLDISRRWGKTFLVLLIKIEDCLRRAGTIHTYACAFGKDIGEIILPLFDELAADAPDDCRPVYRTSSEGRNQGLYFPNGSVLRLVGIDVNPRGLRGRASDGFAVSEAGHVKKLKPTVGNVIYPQFQRRGHARMILESNAPEELEHDFDEVFVADAKARDAYVFATIDDNASLDPQEKEEFIRAAGGRGSATCEREYYGVRVRDNTRAVVPEFDEKQHVQALDVPQYADCYVALDPGMRDLCAILWGYWDFENARLVVQRDWAERNAGTARIAAVLGEVETELWSELQRFNGKEFKPNPYLRVSDTDARLRADLYNEFGIRVAQVNKSTGAKTELKEAAVHSVRAAIGRGQIIIDPACTTLIAHLNGARWNDHRTDYQRSEVHGHFDCLDALVYLWRSVRRNGNPNPPKHHDVPHDEKHVPERERLSRTRTQSANVLDRIFGGGTEREQRVSRETAKWKPQRSARWKRR